MLGSELFRNLFNASRSILSAGSRGCSNPNLVKYGESKTIILVSICENGYLLHLDREEVTYLNWFYGDPTCALISQDSKWVVMGGDDLFIIWNQGVITEVDIKGAFDVRQTDIETVHILIDPWYDNSAIWELNIATQDLKMIRPFTDYINTEYTENVTW
jgi:hypothetical protein